MIVQRSIYVCFLSFSFWHVLSVPLVSLIIPPQRSLTLHRSESRAVVSAASLKGHVGIKRYNFRVLYIETNQLCFRPVPSRAQNIDFTHFNVLCAILLWLELDFTWCNRPEIINKRSFTSLLNVILWHLEV